MAASHIALLFLLAIIPGHCTYGQEEPFLFVGGLGPEMPANPEVQALCALVKTQFLEQSKVNAIDYQAISYRVQLVNGLNFFVKVWLGGEDYAHLRIYEPFTFSGLLKPGLSAFLLHQTKDDPIDYFS
ncbi:cystatin-A1-like [Engystomops pustulosus]|uniref:cystatin-A1-like n=1 Tax=Engystomops pustulosus TaxID=76066 RepID=UPI003AFA8068